MTVPNPRRPVVLHYRQEPPAMLSWWEFVGVILFVLAVPVVAAITWLAYMGREC